MRSKLFILSLCLLLSGCPTGIDSFTTRFWNGAIYPSLSKEENDIYDFCYDELAHMPRKTYEEREKSFSAMIDCLRREEKIRGIK